MLKIPFAQSLVTGASPTTTNTAVAGDYVKGFLRLYIVVLLTQAAAHATKIVIKQATAVAGTGAKVLAKAVPIWANEDVAAGDLLTAQTDDVDYTVTADVKNKMVVFQVEGEDLDVENGFCCVSAEIEASSEATNFGSILYLADTRYPGTSMITD